MVNLIGPGMFKEAGFSTMLNILINHLPLGYGYNGLITIKAQSMM